MLLSLSLQVKAFSTYTFSIINERIFESLRHIVYCNAEEFFSSVFRFLNSMPIERFEYKDVAMIPAWKGRRDAQYRVA